MIPCSGFIEEVLSVDADVTRRVTKNAQISRSDTFEIHILLV